MKTEMSLFNDERVQLCLNKNFAIFFDEMSRSRNACIQNLKRLITAAFYGFRWMRSNTTELLENKSTFFATTNESIEYLIVDPTSARRYVQIETLDKIDWDEINSIDFLELWRGVDESLDVNYLEGIEDWLEQYQDDYKAQDAVAQFVEEYELDSTDRLIDVPVMELHNVFVSYCKQTCLREMSKAQFGKRYQKITGQLSVSKKKQRVRKVPEAGWLRAKGELKTSTVA